VLANPLNEQGGSDDDHRHPAAAPAVTRSDATIKIITDNAQRVFLWNYDRSRDQLVTLYNKGMASQ